MIIKVRIVISLGKVSTGRSIRKYTIWVWWRLLGCILIYIKIHQAVYFCETSIKIQSIQNHLLLELERSLVTPLANFCCFADEKPRLRKITMLVNVMQVICSLVQQVMTGCLLLAENLFVYRSNKTDTLPAFISLQFSCRNRC